MILWLDAQLPPQLAEWLRGRFGVDAVPLRELGLRDSPDRDIFLAARAAGAVIVSKDIDFVDLAQRLGPPPQVLWVSCGNLSNARLRVVFEVTFGNARALLNDGRAAVEIADLS